MSLKDQLMEDMKQAMRDRNSVLLDVIRFLRSEIKNIEIDHGDQSDQDILKIVARQIKSMKDANAEYLKGDRQDLVDDNMVKIAILEKYMPQQMSDEELEKMTAEIVAANPGMQMGQVIGLVVKKAEGQADGGRISQMVRKLLS